MCGGGGGGGGAGPCSCVRPRGVRNSEVDLYLALCSWGSK